MEQPLTIWRGAMKVWGRLQLAEKFYRAALVHSPEYDIFLGSLASFLYLHGNADDAFNAYVGLLKSEKSQRSDDDVQGLLIALNVLGERLGWSPEMIAERIENGTA